MTSISFLRDAVKEMRPRKTDPGMMGGRYMRKLISLIVIMCMLAALGACAQGEPVEKQTQTSDTIQTDPTEEPTSPSQTEPTETTGTPEAELETLEATQWTLRYDPQVWYFTEEDFMDLETWSDIVMVIPDGEDDYKVNVEIQVSVEGPASFRDILNMNEIDAYAYVEEGAYERATIGGVECLKHEGEVWGEPCLRYLARLEGECATVMIEILGEHDDPQVERLLEGLTIHAEDIGNVDAPWPWEGERFTAEDQSLQLGGLTVDSHYVPFQDPVTTFETFDHHVAVAGDQVWLLSEGGVELYSFDGDTLVLQETLLEDVGFQEIQSCPDGTVWLSAFYEDLSVWRDGAQIQTYEGCDVVSMHPSGDWGISWVNGPDVEKVSFSDGGLTFTTLSFPQVSIISQLVVDQDYIYVCGYAADESGHKVFVYDEDAVLLQVLEDDQGESLGSITFMTQIPGGFMGLDGNLRELVFWAEDGTHLGTIDDAALFGTDYPWFCGAAQMGDGRILMIMTEERADESAMELVAFVVTVL